METVTSSGTTVTIYQATRRHFLGASDLDVHNHQNVKCHIRMEGGM
jgi:hypothetical protein